MTADMVQACRVHVLFADQLLLLLLNAKPGRRLVLDYKPCKASM